MPYDQSDDILEKTFVTNDHVLIQFKSEQVPIKDWQGVVNIDDYKKQKDDKTYQSVVISIITS